MLGVILRKTKMAVSHKGISTSIDNQVFIYSDEKKVLQRYDFYPISPNPYDRLASKTVYSAYMGLKPDKSHFVLAYQWLQSLCIVSLDRLSEPVCIKFKDSPFPKFSATDQEANRTITGKLPLQYINLYVTDSHIYALYAGKKGNELENHSRKPLSQGVSIHVFSWDGTALGILNLDRIINCFCVDEKNKIIYGMDPTGDDNSIFYRFDMPEFKYLKYKCCFPAPLETDFSNMPVLSVRMDKNTGLFLSKTSTVRFPSSILLSRTAILLFCTVCILSVTGIIRVFLLEFAVCDGKISIVDENIAVADRHICIGDNDGRVRVMQRGSRLRQCYGHSSLCVCERPEKRCFSSYIINTA
jgi:hypothetical protein